jgi:hypothetical protein
MSGRKKVSEDEGQVKETRGEILVRVCQCLHPSALGEMVPLKNDDKLPKDFRIVQTNNHSRYWVQRFDGDVVRPVDVEVVKNAVASAFSIRGTFLPPKDVDDIVKMASLNAEAMDKNAKEFGAKDFILIDEEKIAPMRFKSDPGWCWHRHGFDPTLDDKTQDEIDAAVGLWEEEVFPRIVENKDSFLAWCGSLAFEGTGRTMSPWLWGEGGSGKSVVSEFVMSIMGDAGCPVDPDLIMDDKFAASEFIGKRIGYISEAPYKLVATPKWKRITGEKYQQINRKGKDAIKAKILIKFIISSNVFPAIKDGNEYERRIMPVRFVAPEGWTPTRHPDETSALLNQHAWYFWWRAVDEYRKDPMLKNIDKTRIHQNKDYDDDRIEIWISDNLDIATNTHVPLMTVKHKAISDRIDWQKLRTELDKIVKVGPRKINGRSEKTVWCLLNTRLKGNFSTNFEGTENDEIIDF